MVSEDIYEPSLPIYILASEGDGDLEALSKGINSGKGFVFSRSDHWHREALGIIKALYNLRYPSKSPDIGPVYNCLTPVPTI